MGADPAVDGEMEDGGAEIGLEREMEIGKRGVERDRRDYVRGGE